MGVEILEKLALKFATHLFHGEYEQAHEMLTSANRLVWPSSWLKESYEEMIDYGDGPPEQIEVMDTNSMKDWASYREGDAGWAYVAITGCGFSEAVALIFSYEENMPKIRVIEWGRP